MNLEYKTLLGFPTVNSNNLSYRTRAGLNPKPVLAEGFLTSDNIKNKKPIR
jgi:hypothetical protein